MTTESEQIQSEYYTRTAAKYDSMHIDERDEHSIALRYISALIGVNRIDSVLDVGCGTGRALRHFREHHRELRVMGLEPVQALLDQAVNRHGLPADMLVNARGESIPFPDQSFDAVCEFAILHHVKEPSLVVREMLRVARKAVFISDANRFGQGRPAARWFKLLAYKLGVWGAVNFVKTRGTGYTISEGDGLAYSYSVYDSYDEVARWADRIVLIPTTDQSSRSWIRPLLTAPHVLLCGFRD
jgi:ubiquinone/menaquinone biosynthesis C-methylase UbiE